MVDTALQNTAAVTMSSNFDTVCSYSIIDELEALLTQCEYFDT